MIPTVAMTFTSAALLITATLVSRGMMGWWRLSHPSVACALAAGAVAIPLWNLVQVLPLGASALSPARIAVFVSLTAAEAAVIFRLVTRQRRHQPT